MNWKIFLIGAVAIVIFLFASRGYDYRNASESVVQVLVSNEPNNYSQDAVVSFGSGVLTEKDIVLSASHVVNPNEEQYVYIRTQDDRVYPVRKMHETKTRYLVALQIQTDKTFSVPVARVAETLDPAGTEVSAHGFLPNGSSRFMRGKIVSFEGKNIFVDLPFESGMSGGAIIDEKGELVGIIQSATKNGGVGTDVTARLHPN